MPNSYYLLLLLLLLYYSYYTNIITTTTTANITANNTITIIITITSTTTTQLPLVIILLLLLLPLLLNYCNYNENNEHQTACSEISTYILGWSKRDTTCTVLIGSRELHAKSVSRRISDSSERNDSCYKKHNGSVYITSARNIYLTSVHIYSSLQVSHQFKKCPSILTIIKCHCVKSNILKLIHAYKIIIKEHSREYGRSIWSLRTSIYSKRKSLATQE